ncbi:MAG: DUF402 domain-containing protein [Bacilli bacterium]|jgi:protein associated with RNAse G/E|nr:DUF402 domain-containing protein [Bacilli bacterium]
MDFALIKSFKGDGSSHRMWMYLTPLKEDEEFYILAAKKAKVIEHDGREWRAPEGALYILSKKRFYNAIVMFCQGGVLEYYVNIASPTIKAEGAFEFIDYDLDLKKDAQGTVREIDWGEYEANAVRYGYSPTLKTILVKTMKEVETLLNEERAPFVDADNKVLYEQYLSMANGFSLNKAPEER